MANAGRSLANAGAKSLDAVPPLKRHAREHLDLSREALGGQLDATPAAWPQEMSSAKVRCLTPTAFTLRSPIGRRSCLWQLVGEGRLVFSISVAAAAMWFIYFAL